MTPSEDQYTVKEYLAAMELRITAHLDRIDGRLESKAPAELVKELTVRVGVLERKVTLISQHALTNDDIEKQLAKSLRAAKARGWTTRNRVMGAIVVLVTVATFLLNLWVAKG